MFQITLMASLSNGKTAPSNSANRMHPKTKWDHGQILEESQTKILDPGKRMNDVVVSQQICIVAELGKP